MTSLLEVSAVRERVHHLSVEEYHRLGDLGMLSEKVELLRGIVVHKMAKSPLHELVAQKLMMLLLAKISKEFQVRREGPLTLRDSEPEPDLSVVRGQADDWATAHPSTADLVIEISISSLLLDLEKAGIYGGAGVTEYWLVRPEDRSVDIFREPTASGYAKKITFSETEILHCGSIPGLEFPVAEILPAKS
jgi:Uma2 family endonuclease